MKITSDTQLSEEKPPNHAKQELEGSFHEAHACDCNNKGARLFRSFCLISPF